MTTKQDGTLDLYEAEAQMAARDQARVIYYFDVPKKLAAECKVRKVGFVQLDTNEELMAARRVVSGDSANKRGDTVFELTKESLRVVDGVRINTGDGSAEMFWGRRDPGFAKLRQLLVTAYAEIHSADDGDTETFLASKSASAG